MFRTHTINQRRHLPSPYSKCSIKSNCNNIKGSTILIRTMSKSDDSNVAAGGKEMKGLVAVAEMMAEGSNGSTSQEPTSNDNNEAVSTTVPAELSTSNNGAASSTPPSSSKGKKKDVTAARARRLEQNRRAAIESRRRKKVMIAELQRSVTFYTKANENLRMDNNELEQRLFHARQRVMQMKLDTGGGANTGAAPVAAGLKTPPEEIMNNQAEAEPKKMKSIQSGMNQSNGQRPSLQQQQQQQQQPVFPVATIPFPHLHPSVSPMQSDQAQAQAQLTATQALYETLGYPAGAARVAANTFSQMVGLTGSTPSATNAASISSINLTGNTGTSDEKKPTAAPTAIVAQQVPSVEEVGSEKYVESLEKFALQQTAAANAAAAAANAAIQALNWHKMMAKKDAGGENASQPTTTVALVPTISVPLTTSSGSTTVTVPLATMAAAPVVATSSIGTKEDNNVSKDGGAEPPTKKQKS